MRRPADIVHLVTGLLGCIAAAWPAAAVPAAPAPVAPDASQWQCQLCPYPLGWSGALDLGQGYVDDASPKFANGRGIDRNGSFQSLDGNLHYRDADGRFFDLYARDLGLDNFRLELHGGRRGSHTFDLVYRELVHHRGFGTRSVHRGIGTARLALPPGWVSAPATGGMLAIPEALEPAALEVRRRIFDARLRLRATGNWRWNASVRHTLLNGTRPFGAGVFTLQSSHFPAPVDFTTDRAAVGLEYAGRRGRMRFGYGYSDFGSAYRSVTWENPFSPVGNTGLLRAALEPDSNSRRFSWSGSFRTGPAFALSGHLASGTTRQDEALLPYSINPDFEDLPLPRQSLARAVESDTLNLGVRLTLRPTPRLRVLARLKRDERNNRTPVERYTPVITDLVLRPETETRPYSFERTLYDLELAYQAHPSLALSAGTRRKEHLRSHQAVEDSEETTVWGELAADRWSAGQLRVRLERSERDISPYRPLSDPGLPENPLLRKFNLAGRDRDRLTFELDLSPLARLDAGLSYRLARDTYDESVFGLLRSDDRSASLDLSLSVGEGLNLYGFATWDRYDSRIAGAGLSGDAPWSARAEDRFLTLGLGLTGALDERTEFGVEYLLSDSAGRIATGSGPGARPFPELSTTLHNAAAWMSYRATDRWRWKIHAERESYASRDWQLDGLGYSGIDAILTLGEDSPDYRAIVLRLSATYRFRR